MSKRSARAKKRRVQHHQTQHGVRDRIQQIRAVTTATTTTGVVNPVRDALIAANPDHAGMILSRDQVVEHWCQANGKDKNNLDVTDIMAIRALPEWQNAG
jgi:hypothetical protein